jgi:hypothetical protein
MSRIFTYAQAVAAATALSLVVSAAALAVGPQAMAASSQRSLNPQPLPPGMSAGRFYSANRLPPAIGCRRVCTQTRSHGQAAPPQCVQWQTIC